MRAYFFYLLLNFIVISPVMGVTPLNSSSLNKEEKTKLSGNKNLKDTQIDELWKGEMLSFVRVETKNEIQSLNFWVTGLHPQNCKKALRKISHYEGYPEILSFVKSSQYNDQTKLWKLKLDHVLMPFPMYLDFKMERVKDEGTYLFTFEKGFLSGLKGEVVTQEVAGKCQLTLESRWSGPKTKIPDIIFSTFVQTLAELGLKNLIRSTKL